MKTRIQIIEDRGYVWDAADALRLRGEYRLLGTAAGCPVEPPRGGAPPACGRLPLVLGPSEVALAAAQGWADLYALEGCGGGGGGGGGDHGPPLLSFAPPSLQFDSAEASQAGVPQPRPPRLGRRRRSKRRRDAMLTSSDEEGGGGGEGDGDDDDDAFADYYAGACCSAAGAAVSLAAAAAPRQPPPPPPPPSPPPPQPAWRAAVVDGARCAVPATLEDAAQLGRDGDSSSSSSGQSEGNSALENREAAAALARSAHQQQDQQQPRRRPLSLACHHCWPYPSSPADAARSAAFADLHLRGYAVAAGGLKYGGDLLAYAGDPGAAHAEFVVRAAALVVCGVNMAAGACAGGGAEGSGDKGGGESSGSLNAVLECAAADAAAAARVAAAAAKTLLIAVVRVAPQQQHQAHASGDANAISCGCGLHTSSGAAAPAAGAAAVQPSQRWAATQPPLFYAAPATIGGALQPFEPPQARRQ